MRGMLLMELMEAVLLMGLMGDMLLVGRRTSDRRLARCR